MSQKDSLLCLIRFTSRRSLAKWWLTLNLDAPNMPFTFLWITALWLYQQYLGLLNLICSSAYCGDKVCSVTCNIWRKCEPGGVASQNTPSCPSLQMLWSLYAVEAMNCCQYWHRLLPTRYTPIEVIQSDVRLKPHYTTHSAILWILAEKWLPTSCNSEIVFQLPVVDVVMYILL